MEIAKIVVHRVSGDCVLNSCIPARMVGSRVTVEFDDPIWDNLVKTVTFRSNVTRAALFDGVTATIPWEVLQEPADCLFFGIWGQNTKTGLQLPLIEVPIGPIVASTNVNADPSANPTLPIWATLESQMARLEESLPQTAENAVREYLKDNPPTLTQEEDPTVPQWAKASSPPIYTAEDVGADPEGTAKTSVSQHNTNTEAHNDIRLELNAINDRLTAFFDSDNQTLDELSEIVTYITSNKSLIDAITTSKVAVTDIIDNLTTNVSNKPLSAAQGVVLKGLIDTLSNSLANYQPKGDYVLRSELPTVPLKVSAFENDAGYLTINTLPVYNGEVE